MRKVKRLGEPHGDGVMSFKEIGERLGITRGGAWMAYRSGMRKLRRRCHQARLQSMLDLARSKECG